MICLSDLPAGALAHVSSFLASPSRALFAIALIPRDVERSSAIVGSQCAALDFGDIEKELAAKLSDHDISGILLCIDAVNKLKNLRLANCINITGVGLESLRGSVIIEQIDLSLVADHEGTIIDPEPPISCNQVLPILESIIERGEDSALKHLQFPENWRRGERNTESDFDAFLIRYNEMLEDRAVRCLKCNSNLSDVDQMIDMSEYGFLGYGTQKCTCNNCMKHYCGDCEDDNGAYYIMNFPCKMCERRYCLHCKAVKSCNLCGYWFCVDCSDFKQCTQCQESTCSDCAYEMGCHSCDDDDIWCEGCVTGFKYCEDCGVKYCFDCCASNVDAVKLCTGCQDSLCGQCRVNKCKEGRNCKACYQFAFPALLKDKERQHHEAQNEINELRSENNELKSKIKDLTG